jgi:hypothetical protein
MSPSTIQNQQSAIINPISPTQELPSGLAAVALNPGIIDPEMLQSTFGASSSDFPAPPRGVEKTVHLLEKPGPRDNGKALTVPQG